MHISSVYLSTYSQILPIDGHFTIQDDNFQQEITFTPEEAAAIQELCAKALDRFRAEAAAKILSADIRVPALEAPKPKIEEANFDEVPY